MRRYLLIILLSALTLWGKAQQIERIDQLMSIAQWQDALTLATSELNAHPNNGYLYVQRARIHLAMDQQGLALLDINDAISHHNSARLSQCDLYQLRGVIHEKAGMYIEAYDDYTIAIEKNDTAAMAYAHRGDICFVMGYYPLARQQYEQAATIDPDNEAYRIECARAMLAAGEHEQAAAMLRQMLADNPGLSEAKRLLAAYHYLEKRYEPYVDLYIEYINDYYKNHHQAPLLANSLYLITDTAGYNYLKQALDYQVQHNEGDLAVEYRKVKAGAETKHQDYTGAIADLSELIRTEQDYDHKALLDRGLCYTAVGNCQAAIKDFSQLIKLKCFTEQAYLHRAEAYRQEQAYDQALNDYLMYAHLDHNHAAEAYRYCGDVSAERGYSGDAVYYYSRSIELAPEEAELYRLRGLQYIALEDTTGAQMDFLKSDQLTPTRP